MKKGMKVYTPDREELMEISSIRREGANLIVSGRIMGSMPMKAVIRPDEARRGLKLLDFKTFFFLLTFLVRRGGAATTGRKA